MNKSKLAAACMAIAAISGTAFAQGTTDRTPRPDTGSQAATQPAAGGAVGAGVGVGVGIGADAAASGATNGKADAAKRDHDRNTTHRKGQNDSKAGAHGSDKARGSVGIGAGVDADARIDRNADRDADAKARGDVKGNANDQTRRKGNTDGERRLDAPLNNSGSMGR